LWVKRSKRKRPERNEGKETGICREGEEGGKSVMNERAEGLSARMVIWSLRKTVGWKRVSIQALAGQQMPR
jgi:hypothetical protein